MSCRKLLITILTAFALTGAVNTSVYAADAGGSHHYHEQINSEYSWLFRLFWSWFGHVHDRYCGHGSQGSPGNPSTGPVAGGGDTQVPELDGSAAAIALLLLGGLIALRRETKRAS